MVDSCVRKDSSSCDPSRITRDPVFVIVNQIWSLLYGAIRLTPSFCRKNQFVSITLDLRSPVIRLGSQLKESFLTHLSTIRFSLSIPMLRPQGYDIWHILFHLLRVYFS